MSSRQITMFNLAAAVLLLGWPMAATAQRSTPVTIVNDGDNPVPTTIEANPPVSYVESVQCEDVPSTNPPVSACYFDVPTGMILEVEKVSGITFTSEASQLILQGRLEGTSPALWGVTLPDSAVDRRISRYVFSALERYYVGDTDMFTDVEGTPRDLRIEITATATGGPASLPSQCTVVGRLHPTP